MSDCKLTVQICWEPKPFSWAKPACFDFFFFFIQVKFTVQHHILSTTPGDALMPDCPSYWTGTLILSKCATCRVGVKWKPDFKYPFPFHILLWRTFLTWWIFFLNNTSMLHYKKHALFSCASKGLIVLPRWSRWPFLIV